MILYDYYRSSAAYRVRIAIALKGLVVERRRVHLLHGEQRDPGYRAKSPLGIVPTLQLDDGRLITQSLAIIDYLDALKPQPPLLPKDPVLAAQARAAALTIACEIHPLANLRVIEALQGEFGARDDQIAAWRRRWIAEGLTAVEALIAAGPFAFGAAPSLADICLVPQVYNARRFDVSLDTCPRIVAVEAACAAHPAFMEARPEAQPDAE
ncbi:maleylacetoacetate isomerase [Methylocystis sp. L43]|uniref:maleylacetoacetate isomerase n=1 Tax=unclassified Methylocystis TaxID=2625913 RepID=UPI0018C22B19|nr:MULTISPECIES: maleylacetoacetate isomerase [unclassified Methylocystis]MBG0799806.1 maleylacetoacetate isomerase [Methylocystis sp. L43]MBG0807589.1 maleylacetoacetate isomerase [Methylocystis sp. H15]